MVTDPLALIGISVAAGLVVGVTGFGVGLVLMGVLAAIMPRQDAVLIATMTAVVCGVLNLWTVRQSIPWREIWPMLVMGIAGAVAGVYLLATLSKDVLQAVVAVMIVAGCVLTLWTPKQGAAIGPGAGWSVLAGALGGVIGGASGAGGPPIVLYALLRGWDKSIAKAAMSAFFAISGLWRIALMFQRGLATMESLTLGLMMLVPMLAALYAGVWVFRRMSTRVFRYAVMVLLGITAANLLLS